MEFFLAFIESKKQQKVKTIEAKEMVIMDAYITGIEVYGSEFEAIRALYYQMNRKICRDQLIVIYRARTDSYIKISSSDQDRIIITRTTKFEKRSVIHFGLFSDYIS